MKRFLFISISCFAVASKAFSGGFLNPGISSPLVVSSSGTVNGQWTVQGADLIIAPEGKAIKWPNGSGSIAAVLMKDTDDRVYLKNIDGNVRITTGGSGNTAIECDSNQDCAMLLGDLSVGSDVGTNAATVKAYFKGADNSTVIVSSISALQASITGADTFFSMNSNTGQEGSIGGTGVPGVIAFNTFTASHWTKLVDKKKPEILTPICSTGEIFSAKEQLVKSTVCKEKQARNVLGFYGGPTKDNMDMALALGTGFAWVLNTGNEILIGDWLVTSGDGLTVQKQEDDLQHNYSAAKALQPIKWNAGEKQRKIAVTYHAG